jgi:hypothetical protein
MFILQPTAIFRAAVLAATLVVPAFAAGAGEIDGVAFPDTMQMDGKTLRLNGYGLRTWSLLNIHIYVAGLYLEHPSRDAEEIVHSGEDKLLTFRFEHAVDADKARDAWRKGFENNCAMPCQLDPADVARFLADVPPMHQGDSFELRFAGHMATITMNGMELGRIDHPVLADAVLRAFLGPKPGSPQLKQALLAGSRDRSELAR